MTSRAPAMGDFWLRPQKCKDCTRMVWRQWRLLRGNLKRRAGGLVLRGSGNTSSILLISSRKHKDQWIIPSGTVEAGETDAQAALREVEEEAGVRSTLGADLGTFYDMDKATVTVIFTMTVEEDLEVWEDMSTRRREWWPIEEVLSRGGMKGRDREVLEAYLRAHRLHAPVKVPPLATSDDPLSTGSVKSPDVSSPACVIEEQERQQEGQPAGAATNHGAANNWYKPKVA